MHATPQTFEIACLTPRDDAAPMPGFRVFPDDGGISATYTGAATTTLFTDGPWLVEQAPAEEVWT
ncbi:MAG: hypothetical protein CL878_11590 [Dehalococcoidia bacterium]|nr:hypothetical protein [Dehalococcoidia bacterium]